jgi:hypothetical protein
MKTKLSGTLLASATLLFATNILLAQSGGGFVITSSVIANGGGVSTGGGFSVSGTIGQPAAGTISGGNIRVQSGFWNTVQTPGAPELRITRAGASGAILSWPAPSTGWVLQETTVLGTAASWTAVMSPTVVIANGQNTVTFTSTTGIRHFRLRHP